MPHTPGPWWVEQSDNSDTLEIFDGFGHTATVYGGDTDEAANNARLIANAPGMLSALRAALASFRELDGGWRDMNATLVDQIIATNLYAIEGIVSHAEGRTYDQ